MRAFVMTMDAMIAVTFIFMAGLLMYGQAYHPHAPEGVYLKQISMDTLTVMEEAGYIGLAIDGNGTLLRSVLQNTPDAVCMQIAISDSSGDAVATMAKDGCGGHSGDLQVFYRPVVHGGALYIAAAQSWYGMGSG